MSKRAEEAALKAYPEKMGMFHEADIHYEADLNKAARIKYIEGYEQAEKDLALTAEDVRKLIEIWMDLPDFPRSLSQIAEETLDIFNKQRP